MDRIWVGCFGRLCSIDRRVGPGCVASPTRVLRCPYLAMHLGVRTSQQGANRSSPGLTELAINGPNKDIASVSPASRPSRISSDSVPGNFFARGRPNVALQRRALFSELCASTTFFRSPSAIWTRFSARSMNCVCNRRCVVTRGRTFLAMAALKTGHLGKCTLPDLVKRLADARNVGLRTPLLTACTHRSCPIGARMLFPLMQWLRLALRIHCGPLVRRWTRTSQGFVPTPEARPDMHACDP